MKLPIKWLRDYVDVALKADRLAELFTMTGTMIEGHEKLEGSEVLNAEITTNRPDCLSMLGLASELAALTQKKVRKPRIPRIPYRAASRLALEAKIQDTKACAAYTYRILDGIRIAPSPASILKPLEWMGQKGINNIVDITNYVMFETGQPLHAFDFDKIEGGQIIVRRARRGEKILCLNNVEYALDERIVVIADAKKPIAIAGVMGGKATEVTPQTQRVVLESARFDPVLVRRAARFLKISTDSGYRFERAIEPGWVSWASDRAASLILQHAKAFTASPLVKVGTLEPKIYPSVKVFKKTLDRVMGRDYPMSAAAKILKSLGLKVRKVSSEYIKVAYTSRRTDIRQECDLIEEIVRVDGFEKIPTTLPATRYPSSDRRESPYHEIRDLKRHLVSQGLWETVTFSMVSAADLAKTHFPKDKAVLKISNPLSQEQEILRPTALVGLLGAIRHNLNRKEKDVAFFEVSKRFYQAKEEEALTIAVTGQWLKSWSSRQEADLYYVKGLVQNIFKAVGRKMPDWKEFAVWPGMFSESLAIEAATGFRMAHIGKVSDEVLKEWDIQQPVFAAEVVLEDLLKLRRIEPRFVELPKFPSVQRDIALLVPTEVTVSQIEKTLLDAAGESLKRVELFDLYQGKNIPKDKRSLAFTLQYQKSDGTFTDEEILTIQTRVMEALKTSHSIELRQ
ncbi:MAG: phenylalanine--tRNA ligase subunit beta [Candidatus Omnitrophica bacterium]|nr:phenylalanine--tRNA ligase subunit beta [Candidatus Omnitrophota bacterium]